MSVMMGMKMRRMRYKGGVYMKHTPLRGANKLRASSVDIGQTHDETTDASLFCGENGSGLKSREEVEMVQDALGTTTSKTFQKQRSVCGNAVKTYSIHTFGCQMNMADSERMAGALEHLGYEYESDMNAADVVVLNTCSIRDKAEQKVYKALRPMEARKKKGEEVQVVVAGCVAGQEGEAVLRRVPAVDIVMGPQHAGRIGSYLEQARLGHQVVATEDVYIEEDIAKPVREHSVRAWVNAIYGCNESCTYCVVPRARGREQSRDPDAIKMEAMALGAAGYKEICLLGQNIDAYGTHNYGCTRHDDIRAG